MNVSRITETLYISTQLTAQDVEAVHELDVGLVIGMIAHVRPPRRLAELPVEVLWLRTFDFFLLPIPLRTLSRGVEAALQVIQGGEGVLVYCQAGRHRSVAMASAILIGQGYSADEAMALIVEKRPAADPRAWHIQRQIRRFEKHWHKQHISAPESSGG
jgi:protein-tyrosine phosphatase